VVTLCVAANTTGAVNATRDHKDLLEVLKRHPMVEDVVCHPILYRDGNNRNIGNVLSPHKGILMETVELRNEEGRSLLLLRDSVLGSESTTTPRDPTRTCTETGHIPPSVIVGANPTVMVIQKLGGNSIQTHRDSVDVLRHILKNVSSRLVYTIKSPAPVTDWCVLFG
jgi:hypothetical protein